jgi:hypothetical protein
MPNHNAAVPSPELVDKEIKVLELRRAGLTWQRIAEETGYADHTGAYAAYKRAIKRTMQQPADELREAELDRIDRLQLALWPKAMKGDNSSVNTIVRLMERRARLLGLDLPIKITQDITTWDGDESIDRAVRDLAALLEGNTEESSGEGAMAEHSGEIVAITAGDPVADMADSVGPRMGEDTDGIGVAGVSGDNQPEDSLGDSR